MSGPSSQRKPEPMHKEILLIEPYTYRALQRWQKVHSRNFVPYVRILNGTNDIVLARADREFRSFTPAAIYIKGRQLLATGGDISPFLNQRKESAHGKKTGTSLR